MFDEEQAAFRLEHAPHLGERLRGLLDAAERKGRDNRVDAPVLEGDQFCCTLNESSWHRGDRYQAPGHCHEPHRRLNARDAANGIAVIWQIDPRTYSNFQHLSLSRTYDSLPVRIEAFVAHHK